MRQSQLIFALAAVLAAALPAVAQKPPKQSTTAAARPYKPVAITLPKTMTEADFETLRNKIADAAKRKDRALLVPLVVAQGFFWERDNGDGADKRRPGVDNLSAALGLNNKESAGWDMLSSYAEDPTLSQPADHKGAMCAPADPGYNARDFAELLKATQTGVPDWEYPVSDNVGLRATPAQDATVVDKLGLYFVRVIPDLSPGPASFLRVVTPSGKIGYVETDEIAPIGNDQICYVKDGGSWKIGGYIGGGEPQ